MGHTHPFDTRRWPKDHQPQGSIRSPPCQAASKGVGPKRGTLEGVTKAQGWSNSIACAQRRPTSSRHQLQPQNSKDPPLIPSGKTSPGHGSTSGKAWPKPTRPPWRKSSDSHSSETRSSPIQIASLWGSTDEMKGTLLPDQAIPWLRISWTQWIENGKTCQLYGCISIPLTGLEETKL